MLTDSTHKLDTLAKKLGNCVDKARPYYEARVRAKEVFQSFHTSHAQSNVLWLTSQNHFNFIIPFTMKIAGDILSHSIVGCAKKVCGGSYFIINFGKHDQH